MSLTRCTDCRRLTFVDAASCPSCARAFRPDELRLKAFKEDRDFMRRAGALFLAALVAVVAAGIFFVVRA